MSTTPKPVWMARFDAFLDAIPDDIRAAADEADWQCTDCGRCGGCGEVISDGDWMECPKCYGEGSIALTEEDYDSVRCSMVQLMIGHRVTVRQLDDAFAECGTWHAVVEACRVPGTRSWPDGRELFPAPDYCD